MPKVKKLGKFKGDEFPDLYYVSDHGNVTPRDWSE
jgi:hypothetical protein